jgi:hypothetical protein
MNYNDWTRSDAVGLKDDPEEIAAHIRQRLSALA